MKIILEFDSYREMEAYCQKVVDSKVKKSKKREMITPLMLW